MVDEAPYSFGSKSQFYKCYSQTTIQTAQEKLKSHVNEQEKSGKTIPVLCNPENMNK